MEKSNFENNIIAAQTMQKIEVDADKQDFLRGYQRGLRRLYHGNNFGTTEEHEKYLANNETHKMLGLGYRSGYAGHSIEDILKQL